MADQALLSRPALSVVSRPQPGAAVTICERRGLNLATMQARRGQRGSLSERIRHQFLLELPNRPAIVHAGNISFAGIGPDHWLALSENADHQFGNSLKQLVAPLASVADQSSGYAVFRVGGHAIRKVLAKGFPIDLHPHALETGAVATTIIAHIGATIWRRQDNADESACFEIALFRSMVDSFWAWFSSSAAEFGCERQGPAA